ncbi:cytidine deaminase [Chromatiales bacterium (ex Bugula neritina AB1)]|nr:cytidine deaminase [Chromatiales bacterium (ex Bugula neritina AB1)]
MVTADYSDLIEHARAAMSRAYAPYSNFPVGAAILTDTGNIYSGCNVENAAYPLGNCAEASAISSMIMGGDNSIAAIAVAGFGDELCTPCGGCRQRIREFADEATPVLIGDNNTIRYTSTLGDLLPLSFGPDNLN